MLQVESIRADPDLFVSFVPPHRRVHSKTLSRWMRDILAAGGVDTNTWAPHSVRAAGAASLRSSGQSLYSICKRADWSLCSRTYKTFYERYI